MQSIIHIYICTIPVKISLNSVSKTTKKKMLRHTSAIIFLVLYTTQYTEKLWNTRKRVCDTVLEKNPFFLLEFNMEKMDEK